MKPSLSKRTSACVTACLCAVPLLAASTAFAQRGHGRFDKEQMRIEKHDTQQMKEAPLNGDPDHDFAVKMMPHHQEAIDMARLELKYGKDPVFRQMARKMIQSQTAEIKKMRRRLNETGSGQRTSTDDNETR